MNMQAKIVLRTSAADGRSPRSLQNLHLLTIMLCFVVSRADTFDGSMNFDVLNDCTCPGYLTSYKCTVIGDGFSIWRGTAFDCPLSGNEILLLHSSFNDGTIRTCNNGKIVGHTLSQTDDCYTSQLDVNVTVNLEGSTVECIHESGNPPAVSVGAAIISITTDPFPHPSNVSLIEVSSRILTFSWRSVSTTCPSLEYSINSTCGDCPTTTQLNAVTCAVETIANNQTCSFSVRSVVCGNIMSNWSTPIYATLKVPEAPVISSIVTKYGTDEQKKLISLDVNFDEEGSFTISEGVRSSPSYYTVLFSSDSLRQTTMCGSANISASHCLDGLCTASLPSPCYEVNGNTIRVTVSGTNSLGEGPHSTAFIGTTNQYVDVTFESARQVVCKFLGPAQTPTEVFCSITYGPCQQRLNMSAEGSSISVHELSHTTVRIDLSTNLNTYCYLINASNGTFNLLMEGSYGNDNLDCSATNVIVAITVTIIVVVIYLTLVCCCLLCCFCMLSPKSDKRLRHTSHSVNRGSSVGMETSSSIKSDPVEIEVSLPVRETTMIVHVVIELQDKPWELLKALKIFKDMQINIMDIMFDARNEFKMRKIYIQCEFPLTSKQKDELFNKQIADDSIKIVDIHCDGITKDTKEICRNKPTSFVGYKYVRSLPKNPGTLYKLLEDIRGLSKTNEAFNWINVIDIILRPSDGFPDDSMVVELRFVCELPHDWKKIFDDKIMPDFNDLPQTSGV